MKIDPWSSMAEDWTRQDCFQQAWIILGGLAAIAIILVISILGGSG